MKEVLETVERKMVNLIQPSSVGHTTFKDTARWPFQIVQISDRKERLFGVLRLLRIGEGIRSSLAQRGAIPTGDD